ncbi:hypothetical protein VPH35_015524 [Triticum aestivum]
MHLLSQSMHPIAYCFLRLVWLRVRTQQWRPPHEPCVASGPCTLSSSLSAQPSCGHFGAHRVPERHKLHPRRRLPSQPRRPPLLPPRRHVGRVRVRPERHRRSGRQGVRARAVPRRRERIRLSHVP